MNQKEVNAIRDVALNNRDSVDLFASRGVKVEELKELFRLAQRGIAVEIREKRVASDVVSHDGARAALGRLGNPDKALDQEVRAVLATYITQQESK